MDQEKLTPELEKLISKVKLKEPPREMMTNYLSEVNTKIDQGIRSSHFGFPQVTGFFVIGLTLAGVLYFFLMHPAAHVKEVSVEKNIADRSQEVTSPITSYIQTSTAPVSQKSLTLEEEMAVLEAFGDEFSDESVGLFGDDEALEELTVLDEVELSPGFGNQASGV